MATVSTINFKEGLSRLANRMAKVFYLANHAIATEWITPGSGDRLLQGDSDVASDARRLFQKACEMSPEEKQQVFAEYLEANIINILAAHLPAGVDPKGVASLLGVAPPEPKSLLDRVVKLEMLKDTPVRVAGKLTIPAGVTPRLIVAVINADSQAKQKRNVVNCEMLLNDEGMDTAFNEDKTYKFAIDNKSTKLSRFDQAEYLDKRGEGFTPRFVLTVAAGKYRLDHGGFPESGIGTDRDSGDLFKGKVVRTASGAVCSIDDGVHHFGFSDGNASVSVAAAGSPKSPKN